MRLLLLIILSCTSCAPYLNVVKQNNINIGTGVTQFWVPAPSIMTRNNGAELIVEWRVPHSFVREKYKMCLDLITYDGQHSCKCGEIDTTWRKVSFSFLGLSKEKQPLTYRATIVDPEGNVVKEWKHRLYQKRIDAGDLEPVEESNWKISGKF